MLFGAVLTLLIIGCANVSILLLARGTARQHELAVRASVGAGRKRLVQQLLTESVVLSVTGALLGVVAAYKGVTWLVAALPFFSFPHEAAIHVNAPVLIFSASVDLTGVLFGMSPAWQLSTPQIGALGQASSSKHTGSTGAAIAIDIIAGQLPTLPLIASRARRQRSKRLHTRSATIQKCFSRSISASPGINPTWESRLNAQPCKVKLKFLACKTPASLPRGFSSGGFTGKIETKAGRQPTASVLRRQLT